MDPEAHTQLSLDFDQDIMITSGAMDSSTFDPQVDIFQVDGNIDWSKLNSSITLGPLMSDTIAVQNPMKVAHTGRLTLTGDDADIEINGESVMGVLKEIRDRLGILKVSEQMEAEWDELRSLREQYEAKLAECEEKSRAWAALTQAG